MEVMPCLEAPLDRVSSGGVVLGDFSTLDCDWCSNVGTREGMMSVAKQPHLLHWLGTGLEGVGSLSAVCTTPHT